MLSETTLNAKEIVEDLDLERLLIALQQEFDDGLFGVVLYGSHARGSARTDSDIDLFVLTSNLPPSRMARSDLFIDLQYEAGYPYPPASILSKTITEFESYFPSLYLDIGFDGIVLFDRNDYTIDKLTQIQNLIEESGLVRQKINGEFIWEFTHPVPAPPGYWVLDWEGYREFQR